MAFPNKKMQNIMLTRLIVPCLSAKQLTLAVDEIAYNAHIISINKITYSSSLSRVRIHIEQPMLVKVDY